MEELPNEILAHIFQFLTVQGCVRSVSRVCRRFNKIVNSAVEIWRTFYTDAEFSVISFKSVIMNHMKYFHRLALRFSQKQVRYNSPELYIENTLALGQNVSYLDLSNNTSVITIHFIQEMKCLKSLILTSCTSIEPYYTISCLKIHGTSLRVLKLDKCLQFRDEHIDYLVDLVKTLSLSSLKVFNAEYISCLFSIENARAILENCNLVEFAITPNWGPPPAWHDFMVEYENVKFGESLYTHLRRLSFYSDEED